MPKMLENFLELFEFGSKIKGEMQYEEEIRIAGL